MIKAGIIGAAGYSGVELMRLLLSHPEVDLHCATSDTENGNKISDCFPGFRGHLDLVFSDHDADLLFQSDVIFFATPSAVAMAKAATYLAKKIRIIDLSADFRLRDETTWQQWYGVKHAHPELLREAVYGLPEINRERIKTAQLVANPGCYPTAILLALIPLMETNGIDVNEIIADAKSGVSGAGRQRRPEQGYCEIDGGFRAYAASGHRHLPEILQILQVYSEAKIDLTFVPHLAPMIRGIEATIYARLSDVGVDVRRLYQERYQNEYFVDVMPVGAHPDTRSVKATNLCRIALHRPGDGDRLVVLSVLDNLVKGAAGQAVQNMNLMFGIEEKTGLVNLAECP